MERIASSFFQTVDSGLRKTAARDEKTAIQGDAKLRNHVERVGTHAMRRASLDKII
jgi:hypothetical protein